MEKHRRIFKEDFDLIYYFHEVCHSEERGIFVKDSTKYFKLLIVTIYSN